MSALIYSGRKSSGALVVAEGLDVYRVRDNTYWCRDFRSWDRYPLGQTTLINWGNTKLPVWLPRFTKILNKPEAVALAISKVKSYARFKEAEVPTLDFTVDPLQAKQWLTSGSRVLARQDGRSGGDGIRVLPPGHEADLGGKADFFTKYFPKTHEYRAHVVQNGVIDLTQKKRVSGFDVQSGNRSLHQRVVRSHDNGWIFAHRNLYLPVDLRDRLNDAAVRACEVLSLDFGAVDLGYDNRSDRIVVFEVNTAPGLESQKTIQAYIDAFKSLI